MVQTRVPFSTAQHLVLDDVSWSFYEKVLEEIDDGSVRVTFDDGRIEIMSPLPEHGRIGNWMGRLIETMALERGIDVVGMGATTFRDAAARKGLEPDECYYIQHAADAREMEGKYDPAIHMPPDLAIEVEVTRKVLAREPIYARLGVPELWRVSASGIQCRRLSNSGVYDDVERSVAFPFLTPSELMQWGQRLSRESSLAVLPDFKVWVRSLA